VILPVWPSHYPPTLGAFATFNYYTYTHFQHNSAATAVAAPTTLTFFPPPPGPTQSSGAAARFAVGQNRTMGFSSLSFGNPIGAREGHNFPRADRCCFRRSGSVVGGFENSVRQPVDPALLLVAGAKQAKRLQDPTHPANEMIDGRGCAPIIQAGDVGSPDVLARLGALAPVHAVRGNVDHGAWSANLPVTQRIEIHGFRIYVPHIQSGQCRAAPLPPTHHVAA
jgi:hypothetical protein